MKVTRLLFLMIGCAAFTPRAGYTAPSNPASQQSFSQGAAKAVGGYRRDGEHAALADDGKHQKDGKPSDGQRDLRHVSDTKDARRHASLTKANRPKRLSNDRQRSTLGYAMSLHQTSSGKSGDAAKGVLIQSETVNKPLSVRPQSALQPTVPWFINARHRGANPAVIGGSVNSDGRKTGAINGTRMIRRP